MKRLRRLSEVFDEYPLYFVTACTAERAPLLSNEATHQVFRDFCGRARGYGVIVGRYVLMPDHLHVFVCIPPGPGNLPGWIKSLKNYLSKHWRSQGIEAPHWQRNFFDHVIRNYECEAEKWVYMRDNPVRAGFVSRAEDWPYAGEFAPLVQQ